MASFGTFQQFYNRFAECSRNRTVAPTKLNVRSSRSHTILLIKVTKSSKVTPFKEYVGKLYLIDLAGSEDNRRTGNTGVSKITWFILVALCLTIVIGFTWSKVAEIKVFPDKASWLKESGAINSSLFSLGKVVDALNQGQQRIPYRDSKLTRLLQDSVGGSAHSLMIVNVSPESGFYFDTLNSLKFGSKSRKIINRPFTCVTEAPRLAVKRPQAAADNDTCESPAKKQKRDEDKKEPEDPGVKAVEEIRELINPIAQRQETFESAILQRLASLEEKLTEKSTSSKPNNTSLERPRTPPLQQKDSSKSRPCGRVKPLFSKNQPVFAKTPLKERTNIPVTKSAKSCSQARKLIGKDIKIGNKDVILLGTPSPLNDAEPGKVNKPSLPELIRAGCLHDDVVSQETSPHYTITIDPAVREECENQLLNHINCGSLKEITSLKGIGKKTAEKIIAWRESNGIFSDLSGLKKVGFSQKMLQTFRKNNLLSRLTIK